mmetsp:Transcript_75629/g.148129  ORF Transcript_75629/g.148129 Transcript_75629/m.148129 type:complete len:472 (+) Transcript_75629:433-1848(+)
MARVLGGKRGPHGQRLPARDGDGDRARHARHGEAVVGRGDHRRRLLHRLLQADSLRELSGEAKRDLQRSERHARGVERVYWGGGGLLPVAGRGRVGGARNGHGVPGRRVGGLHRLHAEPEPRGDLQLGADGDGGGDGPVAAEPGTECDAPARAQCHGGESAQTFHGNGGLHGDRVDDVMVRVLLLCGQDFPLGGAGAHKPVRRGDERDPLQARVAGRVGSFRRDWGAAGVGHFSGHGRVQDLGAAGDHAAGLQKGHRGAPHGGGSGRWLDWGRVSVDVWGRVLAALAPRLQPRTSWEGLLDRHFVHEDRDLGREPRVRVHWGANFPLHLHRGLRGLHSHHGLKRAHHRHGALLHGGRPRRFLPHPFHLGRHRGAELCAGLRPDDSGVHLHVLRFHDGVRDWGDPADGAAGGRAVSRAGARALGEKKAEEGEAAGEGAQPAAREHAPSKNLHGSGRGGGQRRRERAHAAPLH